MYSYHYSVSLVSLALKTHISRNTQWLLPNITQVIWKIVLRDVKYAQYLKISLIEEALLMAAMEKTFQS